MSIRFQIKNTPPKAEKEGDLTVRYSGTAEPFRRTTERQVIKVGVDGAGNPRLRFTTGLDVDKVDLYHWYNEEEKKVVKKAIKELYPVLVKAYGGKEVLDDSNRYFWKENKQVYSLLLTNETEALFFDTEKVSHALLYLSIIGGAFIDTVAPTKEYAERNQIPHYLALETDVDDSSDDIELTRSAAHAMLHYLKEEQPESLFILAWCLQYDTNGFGAYTKSVSPKDLVTYHINYINGKLVTQKKRNMPKRFLEYAEKWKGQQTRPSLYTEAYVKAGDYYSFIVKREKKYTTADGTVLGNTIEDAVAKLSQPKFTHDLEKLRDSVEEKWKS
jgi:hypothetical protein